MNFDKRTTNIYGVTSLGLNGNTCTVLGVHLQSATGGINHICQPYQDSGTWNVRILNPTDGSPSVSNTISGTTYYVDW